MFGKITQCNMVESIPRKIREATTNNSNNNNNNNNNNNDNNLFVSYIHKKINVSTVQHNAKLLLQY